MEMHVAVERSTTKTIVTLLLLLPSYRCHICTWLLFFNDDVDHRHKKNQKKERERHERSEGDNV